MDLIKLGQILKKKRDNLGISLRDAGELIGISHNYLSILEKAMDPRSAAPIRPTIDTLKLICDAYKLEINDLLPLAGYTDILISTNIENLHAGDKYPKSNDLISYVMEETAKYGYDLKDKSKEELAEIIVKALKIDEINKSN